MISWHLLPAIVITTYHPEMAQVARQRRELGATWPVDLTPGGVRMLEVELGGEYSWSLDRLKRRRAPENPTP